ncbi:hypothetical protein [Pseudomonas syringae]|uniref:hypothetical protein n=1 Tax=Pseudomonas syringae TaxID=317 RepID=UPI001F43249D|nr:hypothetical protein [Pseudomonas syringae]
MSKHPIPDWLRSQFSRIEDEVQKLGPCGVFTQMRTVTQTYFEQQAEAPQPPALGGELVSLMVSFEDHKVGQAALLGHIESLKTQLQESTRKLAPLQAEIDAYKASRERLHEWLREEQLKNIHLTGERDKLKAQCDELECDHEWTDDGEFNLHCTKCGKQENHEPYGWVQTRGNAINRFTQEWDVVEEWEAQGFEYKAMFDADLSKPAGSEQA